MKITIALSTIFTAGYIFAGSLCQGTEYKIYVMNNTNQLNIPTLNVDGSPGTLFIRRSNAGLVHGTLSCTSASNRYGSNKPATYLIGKCSVPIPPTGKFDARVVLNANGTCMILSS